MIVPLQEISAHATAEYPAECCGVIVEKDGALAFRPVRNLSARGHDSYVLDPRGMRAALTEGPLWAIVHSHADAPADFSPEDQRAATGDGPEPIWPSVKYVVVSVCTGYAQDARIYTWDPAARGFVGEDLA